MDNKAFQMPVRLGVGSDGKEMTVNLLDVPNMLVVGSHTQHGKSGLGH